VIHVLGLHVSDAAGEKSCTQKKKNKNPPPSRKQITHIYPAAEEKRKRKNNWEKREDSYPPPPPRRKQEKRGCPFLYLEKKGVPISLGAGKGAPPMKSYSAGQRGGGIRGQEEKKGVMLRTVLRDKIRKGEGRINPITRASVIGRCTSPSETQRDSRRRRWGGRTALFATYSKRGGEKKEKKDNKGNTLLNFLTIERNWAREKRKEVLLVITCADEEGERGRKQTMKKGPPASKWTASAHRH